MPDDRLKFSEVPSGKSLHSWHKVWDYIAESCQETEGAEVWQIVDPVGKLLIASVSKNNLQREDEARIHAENSEREDQDDDLPPESSRIWFSSVFATKNGHELFINRNTQDFYWELVDGATHEVPFRLSYLERKAERNPDGLFAYCLGWVGQLSDMFSKKRVRM